MGKKMERVVVTGIGVASPLGCSVEDFWQGLLRGQSGVTALDEEEFSASRVRIGARVSGFDEAQVFDRKEVRRMSRSSLLGRVAADQAVRQARLTEGQIDRREVGVMIGSSIGGYSASDSFFKGFYLHDHHTPLAIPVSMNTGPSANVSIHYGFQGPLINIDAACASAAHAIGVAFNLIRTGMLQIVVAGGADSPFSPGIVAAWAAMRALSERNDCPAEACRPFSADRDGLVLGEGAGVLVLEAESSALERGAPILGEILGYGATSDSYHLTQPTLEGPVRAMRRALENAGLLPEKIDYINAHATGTEWNDRNETAAIKGAFGELAYAIPVGGNKAALGHSIGASGALELIGCLLSIRDGVVPPTINYRLPDPLCDLDYVTEGCRSIPVRYAMSNSFAFGGSNSVLIVGPP